MTIESEGFERNSVRTRMVEESDIAALAPILETWVKDRNTGESLPREVDTIIQAVRAAANGEGETKYFVAKIGEVLVGIMGYKPASDVMKQYALTESPAEIVNAFVDAEQRGGRGVGRTLVNAVEMDARKSGYSEILVNSGPRYRNTAWGFYDRVFGESVSTIPNMYGSGGDAPVWRKTFAE